MVQNNDQNNKFDIVASEMKAYQKWGFAAGYGQNQSETEQNIELQKNETKESPKTNKK